MENGNEQEASAGASQEGTVYTETIVFSPPEQYAADAPYQLAIVDLTSGERLTVRILARTASERVQIGDRVTFASAEEGVAYYRKSSLVTEDTGNTPRPLV